MSGTFRRITETHVQPPDPDDPGDLPVVKIKLDCGHGLEVPIQHDPDGFIECPKCTASDAARRRGAAVRHLEAQARADAAFAEAAASQVPGARFLDDPRVGPVVQVTLPDGVVVDFLRGRYDPAGRTGPDFVVGFAFRIASEIPAPERILEVLPGAVDWENSASFAALIRAFLAGHHAGSEGDR